MRMASDGGSAGVVRCALIPLREQAALARGSEIWRASEGRMRCWQTSGGYLARSVAPTTIPSS